MSDDDDEGSLRIRHVMGGMPGGRPGGRADASAAGDPPGVDGREFPRDPDDEDG